MFTGKTPTDPTFVAKLGLHQWAAETWPTDLLEITDCNLLKDESGNSRSREGQISIQECLSRIIELGILCSKVSANERSPMTEVVPLLRRIKMDYMPKFPNA